VIIVQHLIPESLSAEFLLFEAASVAKGPLARLPLRHRIHPGFHASFQPEVH
jgi:carotenoid cleavage dioxygenase-like enzyme